ncbi:hypothetical protein BV22DRAFT_511617 [Leucogyrophana mollusca]|uniref:Uncharacterized protein n=1 Tax=Leucogyrophana mollusca TaxID=85980 RepID=A0ACB8BGT8_9AGAM|nr:hypothetical protein BV22DRAFT_511617 [Leucogyrophana mollusca]
MNNVPRRFGGWAEFRVRCGSKVVLGLYLGFCPVLEHFWRPHFILCSNDGYTQLTFYKCFSGSCKEPRVCRQYVGVCCTPRIVECDPRQEGGNSESNGSRMRTHYLRGIEPQAGERIGMLGQSNNCHLGLALGTKIAAAFSTLNSRNLNPTVSRFPACGRGRASIKVP